MLRRFGLLLVLYWVMAMGLAAAAPAQEPGTAAPKAPVRTEEEKIGEKAAAELEKSLKPIPNHPDLARLERIANEIAAHTERPEVHYSVKVVASKAINAVSLPGGRIYITEGALAAVESEDELAAILAHEIAHNALRHALQQQERANRADLGVMAGILAGILSNRGEVALMTAQIQQGALNHYGRKAEMEADQHALVYLSRTQYKPVALLTVLEGLASMEESRWRPDLLTTADTHPLARERAHAVEALLEKMGVDIAAQRRQVTERFKVEAKPLEIEGRTIAEVTLNGKRVFAPAQENNGGSPLSRAQAYADSLQRALRGGIQLVDLRMEDKGQEAVVLARGEMVIKVTAGDAAFHKRAARDLAEEAEKTIELALYAEKVSRPF